MLVSPRIDRRDHFLNDFFSGAERDPAKTFTTKTRCKRGFAGT
jgi:hypothetical protein